MTGLVVDDGYLEQTFRFARSADESAALGFVKARDTLADLGAIRQRTFCLIHEESGAAWTRLANR